jgi:hypothetical protein
MLRLRAPNAPPFLEGFLLAATRLARISHSETDRRAKPTLHKEVGPTYADYTEIVIAGPPRIHDLAKSTILAAP